MTPSQDTRWSVILLIWGAGLGAAAQYGKVSVVFAEMAELFPDAGSAIGFTVSLVGFLGIGLGVIAGMVVASFGFRRTLVAALASGAAMSALQSLDLPFSLFLATRVIEGLSHLGVVVAAPTLIAQISSNRHRGAALTLWSTFFAVAFAFLSWFGVPLARMAGVQALFATHAVIMAALALLLLRVLRDVPVPPRQPLPRFADLPRLHLEIFRSPWLAAPAAGWLFYTICFVAILTVLPPYLAPQVRGFVMGAMPLTSIAVSMTLGVFLLRRIHAVPLIQAGFALSALALVWMWADPGAPLACLALAGALGLVQGPSFASVAQLNSGAVDQASSNGALAMAGNLGNTIGTPLMVWVLGLAGYNGMIVTGVIVFICGCLVHGWLAALRRKSNVR
ncbi:MULTISPECIES: MFS transporter [Rhodobacterales]|uniref:MFS transporter n=1 Tax=Rhodobacterales TaxID=204455 RepID=UPI00237F048C|nr:MFS transporter [Phaeobacter gallaeciensis]MDE4139484.1 MFS transporter [Phaeobacter gallaeciensis]MDE4147458.1 MFS transporter [Phaeobacter gallaeciensis]MDE4151677.1 MFS transporter [Phaeobacter gallaeciensis]MDE4227539.1 MFS transporter [Phaeobacter gallaeciensis]MDE4256141.1 MFS transporter [Phaeobacter gallaeciensis]